MSKVTNDDVRHLANLSGLQMGDGEIEAIRADIENILNYVNQLNELDTSGVEPTYQVNSPENIWRADEVQTSEVSREELLALAAERSDNCVKVPKVL